MKRVQQFGLIAAIGNNIKIIEPVGYSHFLRLLKYCKFVIRDSGIQEEITSPHINKRAIILRDSSERPESVLSNHSVLCKIEKNSIISQIKNLSFDGSDLKPTSIISPYGAGDAALKICKIIEKKYL
jgi:UDP-N-acetylglucosamine 2-epimerase